MQNFLNFSLKDFQKNFTFDTRHCNEKSIFIALETGVKSGTEFIQEAFSKNAICTISEKNIHNIFNIPIESFQEDFAINEKFNITVPNSLTFIQELSKLRFQHLLKNQTKAISITGSIGKTTSKEILLNTLNLFGQSYANVGNYNNHIGVPFTILNCPIEAKFLILEMGMNHEGEIKFLTELAPCQFRIITNAKENHSGNFINGTEGVLEAKFEIMEGQTNFELFTIHEIFIRFQKNQNLVKKYHKNNFNVLNMEAEFEHFEGKTQFKYNERTFTLNSIYSAEQIEMFCLIIYTIENILEQELHQIVVPEIKGRGNASLWNNIRMIDESYNASPSSMKNALLNFRQLEGSKLVILGDMLELGENSQEFHNKIAQFLTDFDCILVGEYFAQVPVKNAKYFRNYNCLKEFLLSNKHIPQEYQNILVKASNGTLLWKLFEDVFLQNNAEIKPNCL